MQSRETDFDNPEGEIWDEQMELTTSQFEFLERAIESERPALELGADLSFVIDRQTKLY